MYLEFILEYFNYSFCLWENICGTIYYLLLIIDSTFRCFFALPFFISPICIVQRFADMHRKYVDKQHLYSQQYFVLANFEVMNKPQMSLTQKNTAYKRNRVTGACSGKTNINLHPLSLITFPLLLHDIQCILLPKIHNRWFHNRLFQ